MFTTADIAAAVLAYLIGSLSFAVIVSRALGLPDPHSYGSGNPGATNVLRSGSKKAALLTLLGDTLKGVAAVLLAKAFATQFGITVNGVALVAVTVFLGHLFPVFFGFKGGKGVATAAGVLWALDWRVGLGLTAQLGLDPRRQLARILARHRRRPGCRKAGRRSRAYHACLFVRPSSHLAGNRGWSRHRTHFIDRSRNCHRAS